MLKSEMILKNNYDVDFRQDKSINSLLRFHSKLHTSGFNEYEHMVNILTINGILVNNQQFTRSFQMSLPGIKLSKGLIIFFTFQ